LIAVPSIDKALAFLAGEKGPMNALTAHRRIIAGTPQNVRNGLESVAREYGASEVLVVNILHDHAARRRSYELIARVFDLPPRTGEASHLVEEMPAARG
jgi:alkanesulfonate monooxygenase SsuD/methylene tetrahydromethanopterin reductase-like flavin-dependent oxidoreductase (luciferase family)